MKKLMILISLLLFVGCSGSKTPPKPPKDGVHKTYHKDGALRSVVSYKNGKKNGIEKIYVFNYVAWEYPYKNGVLDGYVKNYDKERLIRAIPYRDGKRHGYTLSYKTKGSKPTKSDPYWNGVPDEDYLKERNERQAKLIKEGTKSLEQHRKEYAEYHKKAKQYKARYMKAYNSGNQALANRLILDYRFYKDRADDKSGLIYMIEEKRGMHKR